MVQRRRPPAELADYSPVKGCMVIRPYGYAHLGAHAARARRHDQGDRPRERVLPAVHPEELPRRRRRSTSRASRPSARGSRTAAARSSRSRSPSGRRRETIICSMYAKWVQSLARPADAHQPVGERRALGEAHAARSCAPPSSSGRRGTRPTRTHDEAEEETRKMLDCYRDFAEDWMAMPVITGTQDARPRSSPGGATPYADRGDDAGRQGAAGGHVARPRPELRHGVRHRVPAIGQPAAASVSTTSWGLSTRTRRRA